MALRSFLPDGLITLCLFSAGTIQTAEQLLVGLEQGLTLISGQKISEAIGTNGELKYFYELENNYKKWIDYSYSIALDSDNNAIPLPLEKREQFERDKAAANITLEPMITTRLVNGKTYTTLDLTKIGRSDLIYAYKDPYNGLLNGVTRFINNVFKDADGIRRKVPDTFNTIYKAYQDLYLDFYTKLTFLDDTNSLLFKNFLVELLTDLKTLLASPDKQLREHIYGKYRPATNVPVGPKTYQAKLLTFFALLNKDLDAELVTHNIMHKILSKQLQDNKQIQKLVTEIQSISNVSNEDEFDAERIVYELGSKMNYLKVIETFYDQIKFQ